MRIGKYEIRGELGRGGFGVVHRAFDPTVGRTVAIKELTATEDPSMISRFRIEATAAANLRHRNIITIYEFDEFASPPYLVMEHLDGEDLQHILASQKPLSLLRKMQIMSDVAEGLHCAHEHGVIHRDVKPANIMLCSDGAVKIMDFGIARLTDKDATRLTQTGYLIGSVLYMSPEQFQSSEVDALCDLWSYGVVYYELLAGTNPFQAADYGAVMYKIANSDPRPITALVAECPKELDPILRKLLARNRDSRYQSLEDVQFDIAPVLAKLQREECAALLRHARELERSNELEKAEELVRRALDLDRDNAGCRAFREQLRARLTAIRQTRPKVEELLKKCGEALERGDYIEAIECSTAALKLDAANSRAQARLGEAQAAQERSDRAARLVSEAEQCLSNHQLTTAFEKASEAQRTDPRNSRTTDLLAAIQSGMVARDQARRLREALSKARGLVITGALDEAIAMLSDLASANPEAADVAALLERTRWEKAELERRKKLESGLVEIKELLRARRLAAAIGELEELAREFPGHSEIEEMLTYARDELKAQRRKEGLDRIAREAWALSKAKKFDHAIAELDRGLQEYTGEELLTRLMQRVLSERREHGQQQEIGDGVAQIHVLMKSGKMDEARQLVSSLQKRFPSDEQLLTARCDIDKQIEQYEALERVREKNERLEQARGGLQQGQLDEAIGLFQELSNDYPDDSQISALLDSARTLKRDQENCKEIKSSLDEASERERAGELQSAHDLIAASLLRHGERPELVSAGQRINARIVDERRRENLDALIRQLELELSRRGWKACSERLEGAEREFPGEPVIQALRDRVNAARQGEEEANQRKQMEALRQLIDQGVRRRDWPFCLTQLTKAEMDYPGVLIINELRTKVLADQQLDAERQRRGEMDDIRARVRDMIVREQWDAAGELIARGCNLDPAHEDLSRLRDQLQSARNRRQLLSQAEVDAKNNCYEEAESAVKALLKVSSNDGEAKTVLASIQKQRQRWEKQKQYASGCEEVERCLQDCAYSKAIRLTTSLLESFPSDPSLQKYLRSATAAEDLHKRRLKINNALVNLEKLVEKGRAEETFKEASAILAIQEEPRAREMLDWAEVTLKNQRMGKQRPSAVAKNELADRPASGHASRLKWITVAGLLVGAAVGIVTIVSPAPPVVRATPRISSVTPSLLSFVWSSASHPSPQSLKVNGDGAEFTIARSDDWLDVKPERGTSPAIVTVSVNAGGLSEGRYSGYVTIAGADQSSKNVPVRLVVEHGPSIAAPTAPEPHAKLSEQRDGNLYAAQTKSLSQPVHERVSSTALPKDRQVSAGTPANSIAESGVPKTEPPPTASTAQNAQPEVGLQGPYTGPLSGRGRWLGVLPENGKLVIGIQNRLIGPGTLSGLAIPGVDATVIVSTPGLEVDERPSPGNHFGRLVLRNNSGSPITRIEISWKTNVH